MSKVIIYTDGGCRGNQNDSNIGGWGAVLQYRSREKELYGAEKNTTNNKMELTSVIRALQFLKTAKIPVEVYSDSAYVVNGVNKWMDGWRKRGWKKSDGKKVENVELWKLLYEVLTMQSDVKFFKVKGHDGVALNERADSLVNKAMNEI